MNLEENLAGSLSVPVLGEMLVALEVQIGSNCSILQHIIHLCSSCNAYEGYSNMTKSTKTVPRTKRIHHLPKHIYFCVKSPLLILMFAVKPELLS